MYVRFVTAEHDEESHQELGVSSPFIVYEILADSPITKKITSRKFVNGSTATWKSPPDLPTPSPLIIEGDKTASPGSRLPLKST